VLAGECVLDAWPGGVTQECRRTTIAQLITTMRSGPEIAPMTRVSAGRLLGKLGDPRIEVLDPSKIQWCRIPAGHFYMGSDEKDTLALGNERPIQQISIPYDYFVSRYPITNAQFGEFVNAGGYKSSRYWEEANQIGFWRHGFLKGYHDDRPRDRPVDYGEPSTLPNHPVVGASWYEAMAFVRWLQGHLKRSSIVPSGYEVCLPSEAEWERAARGTDGRIYPWGNDYECNNTNGPILGVGTSSSVGCFRDGMGPGGSEDMSGNVWEWTRSLYYEYPYRTEFRDEWARHGPAGLLIVLRGGSFGDNSRNVRCAARFRYGAVLRGRDLGFRVALCPSRIEEDNNCGNLRHRSGPLG